MRILISFQLIFSYGDALSLLTLQYNTYKHYLNCMYSKKKKSHHFQYNVLFTIRYLQYNTYITYNYFQVFTLIYLQILQKEEKRRKRVNIK